MTTRHGLHTAAALRHRLYDILEHGAVGDRSGLIVGRLIALLIIVNLVAMTFESVPALEARYGALGNASGQWAILSPRLGRGCQTPPMPSRL